MGAEENEKELCLAGLHLQNSVVIHDSGCVFGSVILSFPL